MKKLSFNREDILNSITNEGRMYGVFENGSDGMKFLCLFYGNPEAGVIYRKIGFKELGQYAFDKPGVRLAGSPRKKKASTEAPPIKHYVCSGDFAEASLFYF